MIQSFDVAIMPHLRSDLTKRMNPLKIYNYFAARRPIVSTEVDNIDDGLKPFIRFAEQPQDFARMIRDSLSDPRTSRAGKILDALDGWLARAPR